MKIDRKIQRIEKSFINTLNFYTMESAIKTIAILLIFVLSTANIRANIDAGITNVTTTSNCQQKQSVVVNLRNFGASTDTLHTVNIAWTINNVLQTSFNWVGTIIPGDSLSVIIDTNFIPNNNQFNIICYPTLSNGTTETINNNDTAALLNKYYFANPTVLITSIIDTQYCSNHSPITLSGYPAGGVFFGNAIIGNIFNPNSAIIGNNEIVYSFTNTNGCTNSDTIATIVVASPTANIITTINSTLCITDTIITLSATPLGGLFSGSGVVGNTFTPSISSPGAINIIYSITNTNNCTDTDTINTFLNHIPNVNITSSLFQTYCGYEQNVTLTAIPSGGVFSGSGVSTDTFSPGAASFGNQNIIYTFTDANNCSNSDTITTIIHGSPSANFTNPSDVCANIQHLTLNGGSPTGGVYFGSAISNNSVFHPSIAGSGTHTLSYVFSDLNGCKDTATANIKVIELPSSNFSIASSMCIKDTTTVIFTGNAGSLATFNWSFDGGNTISGSGIGPYDLSWSTSGMKQLSLSVTDSGCTSISTYNYTNVMSSFAIITSVGSTTACFGDSITLFANSGMGYHYQWYDTLGALTNDTLSYFNAINTNKYYCEVTPANSCTGISDTLDITILPALLANFTLPTSACKDDMIAINFTGSAASGSNYNWNFNNGIIASGSGAGPYNIIWNTDSNYTVSLSINDNMCSSTTTQKNINIISTPAHITVLGNTEFCEGNSVPLSANVGPYTYQWYRNGILTTAHTAIYSAQSSGVYIVKVSDISIGCSTLSDSVMITENTTNFNLAFTASDTNFNIPPFNTTFTNQTLSANDYYWMWSFGDGNTSTFVNPVHQYNFDGTYNVGVIAQNIATGCMDTLVKTNYIICNGGSANPCSLDPSFSNIGGHSICPGDSVRFAANDHTPNIAYQWLRDGILIYGATDSIYYASVAGLYQLMLTDPSCSIFSQPFALTQITTVTPTILSNGNIQPCSNDSMELYLSTSFNSLQWSSGQTTTSIYVKTSGSYIVSVYDNYGCQSTSAPFVVNASYLQPPNICIVGIDTATNHNRIIWERQDSALIDSFRIYKESTVAGIYNLIGSQPFSTLSVFEDINSNVAQQAYRYRITAIDTCGMETAPSPIHKTMHLTINAGLGNTWNLIWRDYEGFNFGSYRIYRSTDSNNLQLLTQVPSSISSYTDLNPPSGNIYYQIEIVAPHNCFPDSVLSKANTNYNSVRSNRVNTTMAPNIGFEELVNQPLNASIYPNPNNGIFILQINSKTKQKMQLSIFNVMGELIHSKSFICNNSINKKLDISTMSKGVYFVELRDNSGNVHRNKFIIQ